MNRYILIATFFVLCVFSKNALSQIGEDCPTPPCTKTKRSVGEDPEEALHKMNELNKEDVLIDRFKRDDFLGGMKKRSAGTEEAEVPEVGEEEGQEEFNTGEIY